MNTLTIRLVLIVSILIAAPTVYGQDATNASRDKTRERLNSLLQRLGPEIKVVFQPSSKSPFVFVGIMKEGLTNSNSLEIVLPLCND
jgi:hypothetical protein